MDISGPGCNPVAAEAQTPQPSKPLPATQTATAEEEQNNTANTQRRHPRRSELKRYYTIGEFSVTAKSKYTHWEGKVFLCTCGLFLLVNCSGLLRLKMARESIKVLYVNADVELPWRINLLYLSSTLDRNSFLLAYVFSLKASTEDSTKAILAGMM